MSAKISFENCLAFLNWQWNAAARKPLPRAPVRRTAVSISRQAGSGAHTIAEKLAARLQAEAPKGSPPWTVFDRNLVERILEDHHLPTRLAEFLPEDSTSRVEDIIDDLSGAKPSSWKLVEQSVETILRLASLGNVILIGRGSNVITARLTNVLHIRLVAPFEHRVAHMQELLKLTPKEATRLVRGLDRARARYLKKYFKTDTDDPLLYDLVLNTGRISYDEAVEIIGEALKHPVAG